MSRRCYGNKASDEYAVHRHDSIMLPHFLVENKRAVLRALSLYGSVTLDFGDALLAAAMEREGASELYSFDRDFDRSPWLNRREPRAARRRGRSPGATALRCRYG